MHCFYLISYQDISDSTLRHTYLWWLRGFFMCSWGCEWPMGECEREVWGSCPIQKGKLEQQSKESCVCGQTTCGLCANHRCTPAEGPSWGADTFAVVVPSTLCMRCPCHMWSKSISCGLFILLIFLCLICSCTTLLFEKEIYCNPTFSDRILCEDECTYLYEGFGLSAK